MLKDSCSITEEGSRDGNQSSLAPKSLLTVNGHDVRPHSRRAGNVNLIVRLIYILVPTETVFLPRSSQKHPKPF